MSNPIQIKKYPNRRLYHTGERRYVNLEDLERMVRQDADFEVRDAGTGEDLTRRILAQVILEQMKDYEPLLPAEFLRFLIKQRGTTATWQEVVNQFAGFAAPWGDLLGMFTRKGPFAGPENAPAPAPEPEEDPGELRDELDVLKQRLAEIEKRLGGKPKK